MEAGELAGLVDEIERREIHRRQEAQPDEAGKIRPGDALAGVEQDRQIDGRPLLGGKGQRFHRRRQQAERKKPMHFKG